MISSHDIEPRIRRANPDDAQEITSLLQGAYRRAAAEGGFRFSAADQKSDKTRLIIEENTTFVAETNGRPVGTITLYDPRNQKNKHADDPEILQRTTTAEFGLFGIDSAHRKTTLGKRLLERIEEAAEEDGQIEHLGLVTAKGSRLQRYYSRLGFQDAGEFRMSHLPFPSVAMVRKVRKKTP